MIRKIVKFFMTKKKTISNKGLIETQEKLKELIYNNGRLLDIEVNEIVVRLQSKIDKLIARNYHQEILKELNGVLVELIDKSIYNNRIIPSSSEKLKEALRRYESFIDDMIIKLEKEVSIEQQVELDINNSGIQKFEDIVDNIREDLKGDKGVF